MIGELRHRITIEQVTRAADGYGGTTETWAAITNGILWAKVRPLSEHELFIAHQTWPMLTHEIVLRYHVSITPAMRIKFGARIFKIFSVINPDERNQWVKLLCEESPA